MSKRKLLRLAPIPVLLVADYFMQIGPSDAETNLCHWVQRYGIHVSENCLGNPQPWVLWLATTLAILATVIWFAWPSKDDAPARPKDTGQPETKPKPLTYLSGATTELSAAIIEMAHRSEWANRYAKQNSFSLVCQGNNIPPQILSTACTMVLDQMRDGLLEVRGRKPGELAYEVIPATHWRSTALHVTPDPMSLWKVELLPLNGVEIMPDYVVAKDAEAASLVVQLAQYRSLIVDSRQFESLWPVGAGTVAIQSPVFQ